MDDASFIISARDKASRELRRVTESLNSTEAAAIALRTVTAGGIAIAGLSVASRGALEFADNLGNTADKLGLNTDELQKLRFASAEYNVEQQATDVALQRFTRRLAEARQGQGELLSITRQYNIELRDGQGNSRRAIDILGDLADRVQNTTDRQEQLRIAFKAFDTEGADLVNLLRQGSGEIERLGIAAQESGLILRSDLIPEAAEANREFELLGQTLQIEMVTAVSENAELFRDLAKAVRTAIRGASEGIKVVKFLAEEFAAFINGPADLVRVSDRIFAVRKELTNLRQSLDQFENATGFDRFIGNLIDRDETILQAIARREEELKRLEGIQEVLQSFSGGTPIAANDGSNTGGATVDDNNRKRLEREQQLAAERLARQRENSAKRLRALKISLASEEAQIRESANKQLEIVQEAKELEVGSVRERQAIIRQINEDRDNEIQTLRNERILRQQEEAQADLEALELQLEGEGVRIFEAMAARQEMVANAREQRLIDEQREKDLLLQINQNFERDLFKVAQQGILSRQRFEELTQRQRVIVAAGTFKALLEATSSFSNTAFKITQAFAIGEAIVNTAAGVTRTLREYPYPISVGFAAAQAALGYAQVRQIREASAGSGAVSSGALSVPGTAPVTPSNPITGQPTAANEEDINDQATLSPRETIVEVILPRDRLISTNQLIDFQEEQARVNNTSRRNIRFA